MVGKALRCSRLTVGGQRDRDTPLQWQRQMMATTNSASLAKAETQ